MVVAAAAAGCSPLSARGASERGENGAPHLHMGYEKRRQLGGEGEGKLPKRWCARENK